MLRVLFRIKKGVSLMAKAKYAEWLTPEGLLKIEGWARDGLIDREIANKIGISERTFTEWKSKFPIMSSVLKKGKDVIDRQVENALLKRALGYEYTETTREAVQDPNSGEVKMQVTKKVTKQVAPDTTAQIFWLKNRKPDKWRDKPAYEDTSELDKLDTILKGLKDNAAHQ